MSVYDLNQLEWKIKHILEWSNIDAGTREVLRQLMQEVTSYLRQHNPS